MQPSLRTTVLVHDSKILLTPQNTLPSFTWSENKRFFSSLHIPQIKVVNMQFYSKNSLGKDYFKPNGGNVWFYIYIFYYPISFNLLRDREREGHRLFSSCHLQIPMVIYPEYNYCLWSYIVSEVITFSPCSKKPH